MAQSRLVLEPEVQEILTLIDQGQNFLLSGGAGSGKTYSLVHTICQILDERPSAIVACITYTNAAVHEISDRVSHRNLRVSTIHDFLWDAIKHFQKELRATLIDLINDPAAKDFTVDDPTPVPATYFAEATESIQYKEYLRLKSGIISHDELLILAERMFARYPKLRSILRDTYRCIFVDEYQDTSKLVVNILLDHNPTRTRSCVIGFFGDAMQSIYEDSIGDLQAYLSSTPPKVVEVKKNQNRRNPQSVIDLANTLRTDGLSQVPSADPGAPNILDGHPKTGRVLFLHSATPDVEIARRYLADRENWAVDDPHLTKELNLTHNLIADKAGFRDLMDIYDKERIIELRRSVSKKLKENGSTVPEGATFRDAIDLSGIEISPTNVVGHFIGENPELFVKAKAYPYAVFRKIYVDKDQLIDDKKQSPEEDAKKGSKRDSLIAHLFKIERLIHLYSTGKYNEFISKVQFRIRNIADKRILQDAIGRLSNTREMTIEEVITLADQLGLCLIDDKLRTFKVESEYIYDRVKIVPYEQFRALFKYVEGMTPFSTQHKTKGREFPNVLVVLDNGKWNHYNFKTLFVGGGSATVLARTQKIFYVCCTRAMENLAVFYHAPDPAVVTAARNWFGNDNVISIK